MHVRKRLDDLTAKDVEGIVDPVVRDAVKAKLKESGADDPKKLDLEKNPPVLRTKHGGTVPIRKVRIRRPPSVFAIGAPQHPRHDEHALAVRQKVSAIEIEVAAARPDRWKQGRGQVVADPLISGAGGPDFFGQSR